VSDWTSVSSAVEEFVTVKEELRYTGDNHCTVVLRCPWSDRVAVANDILGNNRLYPNIDCGAIASSVAITPVPAKPETAAVNGRIQYAQALLTVTYETSKVGRLEKDPTTGQLYSETIEQVIENQKLNPSGFCWATDTSGIAMSAGNEKKGAPLTEGPVRQMYSCSIKRTLYNLASIPDAFWTLPGSVNQASYTSVPLGRTFAAETLLFIPGAAERTVLTNGSKAWHLPMKLAIKPDGWNKFWNPHKSGADKYDVIWDKNANAQYKNFPPADWSTLVF